MMRFLFPIHSHYFVVGLSLGLFPFLIEMKRENHSSKRMMYEVIHEWLYHCTNASWKEVVSALEQLDQFELAVTIKKQYLWNQPSCEYTIN